MATPVQPMITTIPTGRWRDCFTHNLHLGAPLCQGLALLGLALVAETEGTYGGERTSQIVGWIMVVLVTGYIMAALVALLMKRGSRTKVHSTGDVSQPSLIFLRKGASRHRSSFPAGFVRPQRWQGVRKFACLCDRVLHISN